MTTKGRILIADDEEFFLRTTTELLRKEEFILQIPSICLKLSTVFLSILVRLNYQKDE